MMYHTSETYKARTKSCVKYLVVYVHIIAFKKFILKGASEAITPVKSGKL